MVENQICDIIIMEDGMKPLRRGDIVKTDDGFIGEICEIKMEKYFCHYYYQIEAYGYKYRIVSRYDFQVKKLSEEEIVQYRMEQ